MKFNIFLKLFSAMLLSMAVVVGAMMASTYWSFRQGLADYIFQTELARVEKLLPVLAQAYQEQGSWDFLRGNREAWVHLLRLGLGQDAKQPDSPPTEELPPPAVDRPPPGLPLSGGGMNDFGDFLGLPPPPPEPGDAPPNFPPPPDFPAEGPRHRGGGPLPDDPLFLGRRMHLLDANRVHVAGPTHGGDADKTRLLPIRAGDAVLGWLAIRPIAVFSDRLALAFVEQQREANLLIAVLALGLSIAASFLLARLFQSPIRRIAAGAQALAAGRFDTQIKAGSHDELGQLAQHFNLLARTLKSNEQARRQWIADIAHELRTPLAILKGEIEALQDGIRQPDTETLRSLHTEVCGLGQLVGDLHELSVSDLGALNYRRETMDLAKVLESACAQFRQRFAERGIQLDNRVDVNIPLPAFADSGRIFQLFSNLLENTARYTDSPGLCEITAEPSAHVCSIHFQDSAPAVPDEALGRLFERLYRVDKSRSRALGGSGLGLAICQNIVEAHGGSIIARHSPLGGLWITVRLPCSNT